MKTAFDLEFNPGPEVLRTARDAAGVLAPDLPQETLDDVRLLVSELVTNSIRHGNLLPEGWIRVKITAGQGRVRAEVWDSGPGFDPPPAPDTGGASGWGIYLLDRVADRWGIVRNDATCVWFEIDV